MRIRSKAGLGLVTVVAALGAVAPSAFASEATIDPFLDCRQVNVGSSIVKVCVEAGTNKVVDTNGSVTVAPYVRVTCPSGNNVFTCNVPTVGAGKTGFEKNPFFPLPSVNPSINGGIKHDGGLIGTLWVNGASVGINMVPFCVGADAYCPGLI